MNVRRSEAWKLVKETMLGFHRDVVSHANIHVGLHAYLQLCVERVTDPAESNVVDGGDTVYCRDHALDFPHQLRVNCVHQPVKDVPRRFL